jgi:hypothetical protein
MLGVTLITGIGCFTGVVINLADKLFDRRLRGANEELARARDRIQVLESRLADLRLHNEQLARTQEWTNRLLESQERSPLEPRERDRLPAPPTR